MKIEEAKRYVEENIEWGHTPTCGTMLKKVMLSLLDQLDQPEPVVTQCVFDMIKKYKEEEKSLDVAIYDADSFVKVRYWIDSQENGYDQFARAWIAYPNITVEKEKVYQIIDKRLNATFSCLGYEIDDRVWFWGNKKFFLKNKGARLAHTRQQLIDAGFEEVFENPNYEAKEVTE